MVFAHLYWIRRDRNETFETGLSASFLSSECDARFTVNADSPQLPTHLSCRLPCVLSFCYTSCSKRPLIGGNTRWLDDWIWACPVVFEIRCQTDRPISVASNGNANISSNNILCSFALNSKQQQPRPPFPRVWYNWLIAWLSCLFFLSGNGSLLGPKGTES